MEQVFPEKERQVFPYWNGIARVWGDPVRIYRRLLAATQGEINLLLERSTDEVREASPLLWSESLERLAQAVRDAFEMCPFNPETGTGATETDCQAALVAWQEYLDQKKGTAAS